MTPAQMKDAGNQLFREVGYVYSDVKQGIASPESITGLVKNGISLSNFSASDVFGALGSAAKIAANAGLDQGVPSILVNAAQGAASGFATGGPIGAAIGGVVSGAETAAQVLTPGEHFPQPSPGAQTTLARLQGWAGASVPPGYGLYEYVATMTSGTPCCAGWFWSLTEGCAGLYYDTPGFKSPGAIDTLTQELSQTLPREVDARTIIARAPTPPFWDLTTYGPIKNALTNGPCPPSPTIQGAVSCVPLYYGYFYAVGTVFSMLAYNASDQAIAAELLMQQSVLRTYRSAPGVGSVTIDAANAEAETLTPLISFFANRLSNLPAPTPTAPGLNPVTHHGVLTHTTFAGGARYLSTPSKPSSVTPKQVATYGGLALLAVLWKKGILQEFFRATLPKREN